MREIDLHAVILAGDEDQMLCFIIAADELSLLGELNH